MAAMRDGGARTIATWRAALAPAVAALCLALLATPAQALDRTRTLTQMHHTRWATQDGPPGAVKVIAQSEDGYLWVGGGAGLFRFDGVRYERFETATGLRLPSSNIAAVTATADGGLWIGYRFGGASLYRDGQVTHYGAEDGFPRGSVSGFALDLDGLTWATTSGGVARLVNGAWQAIDAPRWGYDGVAANPPLVDRDGTLWVPTESALYFLMRGADQFRKFGLPVRQGYLSMAPDGTVWATDAETARMGPLPRPADAMPSSKGWRAFPNGADRQVIDRDGAMWVSTVDGVVRIADPAAAEPAASAPAAQREAAGGERFGSRQGLSGDFAFYVFEDREGSIWIGTSGGLDRLRGNRLDRVELGESPVGNLAIAAGDDARIWLINNFRTLHRVGIVGGRVGDQLLKKLGDDVTAMHRAPDGSVWMGGIGVWRLERDGPTAPLPMPAGSQPGTQVQAIARDRDGTLWLSVVRLGIFKWVDGLWQAFDPLADAPRAAAISLLADADGRIWFGYPGSRIAMLDKGRLQVFNEASGLQIGNVLTLQLRGRQVWAGGESGLAVYEGDAFRAVELQDSEAPAGIAGIAVAPGGDLWLNANPGISRIGAAEIERALREPGYRVRSRLYDFRDGLPGQPRQIRPLPTAITGSDGRLWFAQENGLVTIDPARIPANALSPPVLIQAVQADGQRYLPQPQKPLQLPLRTTRLQIEYTATSLAIPERVRFRYRLDGVDRDWQDAGTRRTADYTNLAPGDYQFRVIAANDDGIWNEQGATLALTVPPAFVQTGLFRALCAAALVALAFAIYLLRLRQLSTRLRMRLEARHQERERIARELHDTLLQGIQGLILRFQAATTQIPEREPARQMMESALDRADEVLIEGRDRVRELRLTPETVSDLAEALARTGEELMRDAEAPQAGFRVLVQGQPRPLQPLVHDEVHRIAREALANAFRHAGAGRIEAEIVYAEDQLRLSLRDDGVGIDPSWLAAGGKAGHWGLAGMRERASQIGAQLDIWAGSGSGTEVALRVPAAIAYPRQARRARGGWLSRIVGAGR